MDGNRKVGAEDRDFGRRAWEHKVSDPVSQPCKIVMRGGLEEEAEGRRSETFHVRW